MEKTVKQRLMEFIIYLGITQARFERACGMSNGYINNLKKTLGAEKLQNVLRAFPELNTEWLLYGEGEMLKPQQQAAQNNIGDITITGNNNTHIGHGNRIISHLPQVIELPATGEGIKVTVECPKCKTNIKVPSAAVMPVVPTEVTRAPDVNLEFWRQQNFENMKIVNFGSVWSADTFAVRVDTRAMEPTYREGTFLVLRKLDDLSCARADGTPYVVDTMRPHTLFRNLIDKYDGTYLLTANSDKRSDIRVKAEDITNIYDIVGSFRIGR